LSHTLGLDVIAEGVETIQQMEILKGLNCDFGQGWLWSHSLKAGAVESYLLREMELSRAADREA
jgi:EAL domain-containing protein (putative c-di-GMP-specific phosphodiesterase class I)